MVEQLSLEFLAREVRDRARISPVEVVSAPRIALRLLGPTSVRVVPHLSTRACLAKVGGGHRIFVRANSPDANFDVAHELGHWALREVAGYVGDDEEALANLVGAALIAPPPAMRAAYDAFGKAPARLAKCFAFSQTAALLRIAEVRGDELAIVTKNANVMLRTQGRFPWAVDDARRWARGRAPRDVVKVRLTGAFDQGRVALLAV